MKRYSSLKTPIASEQVSMRRVNKSVELPKLSDISPYLPSLEISDKLPFKSNHKLQVY